MVKNSPKKLDGGNQVGEWVSLHPITTRVFLDFEIDYCWGGFITLREACRRKNLATDLVLDRLSQALDSEQNQQFDES